VNAAGQDARARRVEAMFEASSDAIQRRDDESAARLIPEFWHPECEWRPLIAGVEGTRSYRGHAGVRQFFDDLTSSFEVNYRDRRFIEVGESVVFLSTMELRGRGSDVDVERELGVVYEFDGELIKRATAYESHQAALDAAEGIAVA
jgi:hypothetical protein